ncbi:MAG: hypothetical protein HY077_16340 [Elusimicrobia bacterium]|nr:hypothetical protein [Elusimicrobiota bacterium]
MRVLLLVLALSCGSLISAEEGVPSAPAAVVSQASPQLVSQIGASAELRRLYHGFTPEERAEFNRVFDLYQRHVARRLSQGWVFHDDPAVNGSISALKLPDEIVALSLYDLQNKQLPGDMQRLEAIMNKQNRNQYDDKIARQLAGRIEDMRRDEKRVWGRCGDWADEIDARLWEEPWSRLDVGHTEMITNRILHTVAGAAAEHASVRVCGKTSGLCAVLDPWRTGKAAVQGPEEWRDGGKLKMCLSDAKGEHSQYCASR